MKLINLTSWLIGICACLFGLSAKAGPEAKEYTHLEISFSVVDKVNLDGKLRATPIEVRVYELKSNQTFDTADYFSLQNKDKDVLGDDLLKVDTFLFQPGDQTSIIRKSDNQTTAIGVMAGYRDLERSVWRVTQALPEAPVQSWYRAVIPNNKLKMKIEVGQSGLKIVSVEK